MEIYQTKQGRNLESGVSERLGLGEDTVMSGDQNHTRLSHLFLASCSMSPFYRWETEAHDCHMDQI